MDNSDMKAELRQRMSKLRTGLTPLQQEALSRAACRHAAEWLDSKQVQYIMIYMPFRAELDTKPLIEWCWNRGIAVILPRVHPPTRSMKLYRLDRWEDLEAGAYGIMEPDPKRAVRLAEDTSPDVVFVPGLAFDLEGGRLGYGGGYYDRFAERTAAIAADSAPIWLGIGYELQVIDGLPMDKHDKRMDGIVTERGLRLF